MINGNRDFSKRNLEVQKCYVCEAKLFAAMTSSQIEFSSKKLNKPVLEDSGDGKV